MIRTTISSLVFAIIVGGVFYIEKAKRPRPVLGPPPTAGVTPEEAASKAVVNKQYVREEPAPSVVTNEQYMRLEEEAASEDPSLRRISSKEAGTAAGPSVLVPTNPDGIRLLYGYQGPYYRMDISGHNVVVLAQTLYQWPITDWKVSGLIRNETGSHVQVAAVTAHLFDSRGNELGSATAWLPLNRLRPGEPAPFVLTTSVPASLVSSIDWHIDYALSGPSNRMFQIIAYWDLPFGDRQRHTGYPFDDPANPPYPYVVFGSFRNVSAETVDAARLVGAWLDDQKRVIYVDWLSFLPLADPNPVPQESIGLSPGSATDYIYENAEPAVAARLSTATLALWEISQ
jgi:hypothetical protein